MPNIQFDLERVSPAIRRILANHLLCTRPGSPPDYKAESEASANIVRALLDSPQTVLQSLADSAAALTGADASGISLATRRDGANVFVWEAVAGSFAGFEGQLMPRAASPCGTVLDLDSTLLMIHPAVAYEVAAPFDPPIHELLLVPFHQAGQAIGTLWVVSQSGKQFCGEDARVITNLSELAAVAYQVLSQVNDLHLLNRAIHAMREGRDRLGDPLH